MNYLVINLGLKSVRCIVFDSNGQKLTAAAKPVMTYMWDVKVEQDPNEWWEKTVDVVDEALNDLNGKRDDIRGITVTASASCLVCMDRKGNPLRNAIMVSDRRSTPQVDILDSSNAFSDVAIRTGQNAKPDLYIPKIMWVYENEPDIYEKTWKFLSPADFLIFKLCGAAVTDPLSAMKYHYNPEIDAYPNAFLTSLSLDLEKLPQVESIRAEVGRLNHALAERWKMASKTPVILTTYDALCSVIGTGVYQPGQISDVSGTVTSVRTVTDRSMKDALGRIFILPWLNVEGRSLWLAGGSNNLGGGLIEWVKQMFMPPDTPNVYTSMEREAAKVGPGSRGIIFLPYLLGERAPLWNSSARGVFFGLERIHNRKDIFRAVFESSAYCTRQLVAVQSSMRIVAEEIYLSGGLVRIPLISQIKANVLGIPVHVAKEFESTALGAAILLRSAVENEMELSEICSSMVYIEQTYEPIQSEHRVYSQFFQLFQSLYTTLRGAFDERQVILDSPEYRALNGPRLEAKENL